MILISVHKKVYKVRLLEQENQEYVTNMKSSYFVIGLLLVTFTKCPSN